MGTVRREVVLGAGPAVVWDAVRDVGAVHERLCPGVLLDARPDGDGRVVTFAAGPVVREEVVTADADARRLVYTVTESPFPFTHHQASMQVLGEGAGSRLVWVSDLLPDELAPGVAGLMDEGVAAMRRVFPVARTQ